MAISKIKINNVEHELQTTIQNVSGLEAQLNNKVSSNQGSANSGKVLGIGADGLVVPTESGGMASLRHDSANKTVVLENVSVDDTVAAGLTGLGITATAEELNYMDGVTSNVQTQLNEKAWLSQVLGNEGHIGQGETFGKNFLSCDTSNRFGTANQRAYWYKPDDTGWLNFPADLSGVALGMREVFYYDKDHILVKITEFLPYRGRIWHNVYDYGWSGWKSQIDADSSQALTNKTYNGYTLGNACSCSIIGGSSAYKIGTSNSLTTEAKVYYGLPTINGSHTYSANTNIYAPTSVGTSGYILRSNGSGAPSWISTVGGNGLLFTAIQTVSVNIAQYGFLDTTLTPTQYGGFTPIMATLAYPANDDMYCNKCFLSGNTIYLGIKAPHSSCNGTVGIFVLYVRT